VILNVQSFCPETIDPYGDCPADGAGRNAREVVQDRSVIHSYTEPNLEAEVLENGVTEMVRRLIFHLCVVDLVGRLLREDHRYADSFGWH